MDNKRLLHVVFHILVKISYLFCISFHISLKNLTFGLCSTSLHFKCLVFYANFGFTLLIILLVFMVSVKGDIYIVIVEGEPIISYTGGIDEL